MYQLKTQLNDASVEEFLSSLKNQKRKEDAYVVLDLMSKITKEEPKMWGKSIIGFGKYHYKTKSGIESDWMKLGFSPRVQNLTLYIMPGFDDYDKTGDTTKKLENLGKYKIGKSCLYINKIEDIDLKVLESLIQHSWKEMNKRYG